MRKQTNKRHHAPLRMMVAATLLLNASALTFAQYKSPNINQPDIRTPKEVHELINRANSAVNKQNDKYKNKPRLDLAVAFVVALVLLCWLLIWLNRWQRQAQKRRTEAIQAFAAQMGWAYTTIVDPSFAVRMAHFSLFSRGSERKIYQMMQGRLGGADVTVFEYTYRFGAESKAYRNQTVARFHSPRLNLPLFNIRPEGVWHKAIAMVGYQDIDFQSHPGFSAKFVLRGEDEEAVRRLFNADLLNSFERFPPIWVEGKGGELIIYRFDKEVKPEHLTQFLNEATDVLNAFESYTSFQNPAGQSAHGLPQFSSPATG